MTSKEFASILDVKPQTATNKITGQNTSSVDDLFILSTKYDIPIDYFIVDSLSNNLLGLEFIMSKLEITYDISPSTLNKILEYIKTFNNYKI